MICKRIIFINLRRIPSLTTTCDFKTCLPTCKLQFANRLNDPNYINNQLRSLTSTSIRLKQNIMTMKTNRLSHEKSPYLLQHATNPIDWYPWCEEAFELARNQSKPIFLSIGYSTCHWCHVMEKESFENPEIAEILNKHFVCIKVDREERPDVDRLYMSFIQASIGGGGWPMSIFLLPTLEPIFGGTYFPPTDRLGRPGFKTLILTLAHQWDTNRQVLCETGKHTMDILKRANASTNSDNIPDGVEVAAKCQLQYTRAYQDDYGGFSVAPKFPQPTIFNLLMHIYACKRQTDEGQASLAMCLHTLKRIAYGGIHDHVNGGFHRYSVDQRWHVPHFEKMLYDQAQLSVAYIDAFVVTKDEFYSEQACDILDYVSRDLAHPLGGFYGAEDADSYPSDNANKKVEGAFCVWTYEEIAEIITDKNDFTLFCHHFDVEKDGNVKAESDPHGELFGKNVLSCFGSYEATAEKFGKTVDETRTILRKCSSLLYEVRLRRPKPDVDTKMITSWNGLMISGFAKAGFVLKRQDYINKATLTANFIRKYLFDDHNKMLSRCCYTSDRQSISCSDTNGFLDDYTFLIRGLLDLYEASLDVDWLEWAETLQEQQDRLFWDDQQAGYYQSSADDSTILLRSKEDQDGAEPCGNSVAVHNLIRLAAYLDRTDLRAKAGRTLGVFAERLNKIPIALPEMVSALMFYDDAPTQVFIAGKSDDNDTQALLDVVRTQFIPGRILAIADGPSGRSGLLYRRHETLSRLHPVQGKPAAYVCRNFACLLPVTEPSELAVSLNSGNKNN